MAQKLKRDQNIKVFHAISDFDIFDSIRVSNGVTGDFIAELVFDDVIKGSVLDALNLFDTPLELTYYTNNGYKATIFRDVVVTSTFRVDGFSEFAYQCHDKKEGPLDNMLLDGQRGNCSRDAIGNLVIWLTCDLDVELMRRIVGNILEQQNEKEENSKETTLVDEYDIEEID